MWVTRSIHKVRERPDSLLCLSDGERICSTNCHGGVRVTKCPGQAAVEIVVVLERRPHARQRSADQGLNL